MVAGHIGVRRGVRLAGATMAALFGMVFVVLAGWRATDAFFVYRAEHGHGVRGTLKVTHTEVVPPGTPQDRAENHVTGDFTPGDGGPVRRHVTLLGTTGYPDVGDSFPVVAKHPGGGVWRPGQGNGLASNMAGQAGLLAVPGALLLVAVVRGVLWKRRREEPAGVAATDREEPRDSVR